MSRIDEALRRASARTAGASGALSVADTPPHGAALEHFSPEAAAGSAGPVLATASAGAARPAASLPRAGVGPHPARRHPDEAMAMARCGRLASRLVAAQGERGLRTAMVTSAVPGEGHPAVAIDLAVALTRFAPRVLLVDADLHAPSLHEAVGVPGAPGLAESLATGRRALPFIKVSERLFVLTAGHVSELGAPGLASERMTEIVDECAAMFHWVVLSTSPVSLLPDAEVLARRLGAVAFVIGAGTPFAVAQRAMARIDRDLLVGTFLCGLHESPHPPDQSSK